MANKYMLTIELNEKQYKRLSQMAKATGKPAAEVVADAFKLYDEAVEEVMTRNGVVLIRDKRGIDRVLMEQTHD